MASSSVPLKKDTATIKQDLWDGVGKSDFAKVEAALAQSPNIINEPYKEHLDVQTYVIARAIEKNNLEMVKYLIKRGAKTDIARLIGDEKVLFEEYALKLAMDCKANDSIFNLLLSTRTTLDFSSAEYKAIESSRINK